VPPFIGVSNLLHLQADNGAKFLEYIRRKAEGYRVQRHDWLEERGGRGRGLSRPSVLAGAGSRAARETLVLKQPSLLKSPMAGSVLL